MTRHFDAVEYINELEAAGVSQAHAKAHANALQRVVRGLAGKSDLEAMSARITRELDLFKACVAQQFQAVEARLNRLEDKLEKMEARLNGFETRLAAILADMRIHRWALGLLGALQIATFARVWML